MVRCRGHTSGKTRTRHCAPANRAAQDEWIQILHKVEGPLRSCRPPLHNGQVFVRPRARRSRAPGTRRPGLRYPSSTCSAARTVRARARGGRGNPAATSGAYPTRCPCTRQQDLLFNVIGAASSFGTRSADAARAAGSPPFPRPPGHPGACAPRARPADPDTCCFCLCASASASPRLADSESEGDGNI